MAGAAADSMAGQPSVGVHVQQHHTDQVRLYSLEGLGTAAASASLESLGYAAALVQHMAGLAGGLLQQWAPRSCETGWDSLSMAASCCGC
mmetsp:Transcript_64476/g.149952  ORF Transcript_64476/g.149952 Transcript_64476/m.149952 type:complete len:90 (-) Transcript_64476:1116-1385(-)